MTMRLLFLGTGAAQGYPALFCSCVNCDAARERGGRSLRRRAALLVNDDLLLDFGPDLFAAAHAYGLALYRVRHLLLTHADGDHLTGANFDQHRERWAQPGIAILHVYGSDATLRLVRSLRWSVEELRVALHPVEAGQTFAAGAYHVTALPARHAAEQQPLLYVVQQGAAAFLYATDTGPFLPGAWQALERLAAAGVTLDAAVIEGTTGQRESSPTAGHLSFDQCVRHHHLLRERGIAKPHCLHLATHFAPGCRQFAADPSLPLNTYGTPLHEEALALYAPHGVAPAYDGQVIILPA